MKPSDDSTSRQRSAELEALEAFEKARSVFNARVEARQEPTAEECLSEQVARMRLFLARQSID